MGWLLLCGMDRFHKERMRGSLTEKKLHGKEVHRGNY
jgi:hypothetical protein